MLAELCAAATGSPGVTADSKAVAIHLTSASTLNRLLCEEEAAHIQEVFSAVKARMSWSPQHAAVALLGLGLQRAQHSSGTAAEETASAALQLSAEPRAAVLKEPKARAALLRTTGQQVEAVGRLLR